jgi:hypothetical protein
LLGSVYSHQLLPASLTTHQTQALKEAVERGLTDLFVVVYRERDSEREAVREAETERLTDLLVVVYPYHIQAISPCKLGRGYAVAAPHIHHPALQKKKTKACDRPQ